MRIKEFIENNLGHVSYIGVDENTKEAFILDPKRDIEDYITYIENYKLNLKYIINTHPHADFVGGHLELKNYCSNAQIVYHKNLPANYPFFKVQQNDELHIGEIKLNILETPGHTPYCISILVEEDNIYKYIFTGDFLFVGDIGRPDLLGEELKNELIDMSYNSAKKLWFLADEIIVLPSHIGGSLCGKALKNQFFSTIGIEKQTNKGFRLTEDEKMYKKYLKNLEIETPNFFKKMSKINIEGPKLIKELEIPEFIDYKTLKKKYNINTDVIIDIRHPNCFRSRYIKGSINIYEDSNIELIAGSLIEIDNGIFLVGSKKSDFFKVIKHLRMVGFDNIKGILKEDVNDLKELVPFKLNNSEIKTIDLDNISNDSDYYLEISHIKEFEFQQDISYRVLCKNGYKSMAVESFIKKINGE